jgi:hypothetical protein
VLIGDGARKCDAGGRNVAELLRYLAVANAAYWQGGSYGNEGSTWLHRCSVSALRVLAQIRLVLSVSRLKMRTLRARRRDAPVSPR